MARIIFYALTSLVVISLTAGLLECGLTEMFGITEEELTKRLADNQLAPDDVYKLIKKGSHAKNGGEIKLNGLRVKNLLELNHMKMDDCDDDIVLERIEWCEKAAQAKHNHFASVVYYCRDRVAKLIGHCAENIEELNHDYILQVQTHHLDIIRLIMARHIHDDEPDFKSLIDEHLAPHEYDRPLERKHADLGNSCEDLTRNLAPIKVIVEHEKEFGVAPTKSERVLGWLKAYKMCEFYFANYKDCEGCARGEH